MHPQICVWCGEYEAGHFPGGSEDYCSAECWEAARFATAEEYGEFDEEFLEEMGEEE